MEWTVVLGKAGSQYMIDVGDSETASGVQNWM